jgi:hypothetical protein
MNSSVVLDCLFATRDRIAPRSDLDFESGVAIHGVDVGPYSKDADGAAWRNCWSSTAAPLVGLIDPADRDPNLSAAEIQTGMKLLQSDSQVAAWLPGFAVPELSRIALELPLSLSTLCFRPASGAGCVFRRQFVANVGALRSVFDPFWDVMIRLVSAGLPIRLSADGTRGLATAEDYPELTPAPAAESTAWLRHELAARLRETAQRFPLSAAGQAALQAGVWQFHGELEFSHRISQEFEGQGRHQLCDYWHAIMHRREPDFANSRYWFRRIGRQPVFEELAALVTRWLAAESDGRIRDWRNRLIPGSCWDPLAFVDLAEAARKDLALDRLARRIQWAEMLFLLKFNTSEAA